MKRKNTTQGCYVLPNVRLLFILYSSVLFTGVGELVLCSFADLSLLLPPDDLLAVTTNTTSHPLHHLLVEARPVDQNSPL